MPPLRQRPEDIPELTQHLLESIAASYQQPVPTIDDEALEALKHYRFPGNVRELENILERAFALCEKGTIRRADLGELSGAAPTNDGSAPVSQRPPEENLEDYLARVEREALQEALEASRWNKTAAAKRLGISFRSLRYRLSKLGLDNSEESA
jgi:two-component system response regulator PilR (NtrC family)